MNKPQLIMTILDELRKAQTTRWSPSRSTRRTLDLPPRLWLGDGRSIAATESLLNAVVAYTRICWDNEAQLKSRFKLDELNNLASRSFGRVLAEVDLDLGDEVLAPLVGARVQILLAEQIDLQDQALDLTLGCHLIEGDEPYPLEIGPVVFEARELWRQRLLANGNLSATTARRLYACWEGKRLRKRKNSFDSSAEKSILNALGDCPIVCTVATEGLSGKYHQEKGLLAARLAMAAISLIWDHPSSGLKWMKLLYDRRQAQRYTVVFGVGTNVGSNSDRAEFPAGRYSEPELLANICAYHWLFDQIGEALYGYVQPNRPMVRPKVMNALFLSLWWYHEACREPLDQIATTKFAASMDALTGGKKARGIIQLIGARLGLKPDDQLMRDGRTTAAVIAAIYDVGRSKLIHGSSADFGHDWTQVRGAAESVGRWLLVSCCDQLSETRGVDDLGALLET